MVCYNPREDASVRAHGYVSICNPSSMFTPPVSHLSGDSTRDQKSMIAFKVRRTNTNPEKHPNGGRESVVEIGTVDFDPSDRITPIKTSARPHKRGLYVRPKIKTDTRNRQSAAVPASVE